MGDTGISKNNGATVRKNAFDYINKDPAKKDKGAMVVKSEWADMNKAGQVDEAGMNPAAAIARVAPDGKSVAINDQYHQIVVDDEGVIKIYDRKSRNDSKQVPSAYIKEGVLYTRDPSSPSGFVKTVLPEGENRIVLSNGTDIFLRKSDDGLGWDIDITQTGVHRDVGNGKDSKGAEKNGVGGAHFQLYNVGSGKPFDNENGTIVGSLGDAQEFVNLRGSRGPEFEPYAERLIEYYEENPGELKQAIALQNKRGGDRDGHAIGSISAKDFVRTYVQPPLLDGAFHESDNRQSTLNPIVLASMTHSQNPNVTHEWGERNTNWGVDALHGHDSIARSDNSDGVNEDIYDPGAAIGTITMRSGYSGANTNFRNAGAFLGQSVASGKEVKFFEHGGPFPADGSEPTGAGESIDSPDDAEDTDLNADTADSEGGEEDRGISFREWISGNITPAQWSNASRSDDDEAAGDRPEKKKYSGPRW